MRSICSYRYSYIFSCFSLFSSSCLYIWISWILWLTSVKLHHSVKQTHCWESIKDKEAAHTARCWSAASYRVTCFLVLILVLFLIVFQLCWSSTSLCWWAGRIQSREKKLSLNSMRGWPPTATGLRWDFGGWHNVTPPSAGFLFTEVKFLPNYPIRLCSSLRNAKQIKDNLLMGMVLLLLTACGLEKICSLSQVSSWSRLD